MKLPNNDILGFLIVLAFTLIPIIPLTFIADTFTKDPSIKSVGLIAYPVPCFFAIIAALTANIEAILVSNLMGYHRHSRQRLNCHVVVGILMTIAFFSILSTEANTEWVFDFGRRNWKN